MKGRRGSARQNTSSRTEEDDAARRPTAHLSERTKVLVWRLSILTLCLSLGWYFASSLSWRPLWDGRYFLLKGLANTWLLSFLAIAIGMAAGVVLAALRLYAVWGVRHVSVALIEIIRSTPDLMVIFWVYYSFPGLMGFTLEAWTAAVSSLSMIAAVYLAEDFRAGITSVPVLQWESGAATGLSSSQIFASIVVPQALRNMVPAFITTFVKIFKVTSIVFVVGVIEFFRAAVILNNREHVPYETYFLVAVVYFICSYGISAGVHRIGPRYELR